MNAGTGLIEDEIMILSFTAANDFAGKMAGQIPGYDRFDHSR